MIIRRTKLANAITCPYPPKCLLYLLTLLSIPNLFSQSVNQAFTDVISAPATTMRSGSIVRLDITIKNNSSETIFLPANRLGPKEAAISIWDSNGSQLATRDEFKSYVLHSSFGVFIDPGKSMTESVDLNRWFDFTKPGQYTVQARKRVPKSDAVVESNKVTITIIP